MTDILPPAGWPNVRQLETNEFASGGANGNMNEQAKSLAARSELLKQYAALPYESKTGGYALNERVQLATGDIVRSTIPSNVNNPNVDMTGWVKTNSASQIFDESGKSQQEVNNISLDPNLAPMGWTQKDFNDSYIDVRKFIKKDLSNATEGLQAAIEEAYGQTLLIPIQLNIQDTIYVNKGLKIKGNRSSAYRYATDVPLLNFSGLSSGKNAIYVAESSDVIGFGLENIYALGSKNGGAGLKLGTSLSLNCADYNIEKALFRNFSTGIEQSFAWDGSFRSVRVQSCTDGIKHLSQVNAVLYSQCAVVGSSNLALQFINSEGVQFDACDISNCTKTDGAPITLFQSIVTFNTPYFENIDNASSVISVGSTSETTGSKLTINSPFKLGKDIAINGSLAYVEITGHDRNNVGVKGSAINIPCRAKVTQKQIEKANKSLNSWNPKQPPNFSVYTGSPLITANRNFVKLSSTANAGYNLSTTLEVGKLYTLIYSIRKTATTTEVSIRHPSSSNSLSCDNTGEVPTIRYISFRATSQNLNLTFIGDIELYGFCLREDNIDTFENDPFCQSEFDRVIQVVRSSIPAEGTWKVGDYVKNQATTPNGAAGSKYITKGWIRITASENNVAGTDWIEDRVLTGT